MLEDVGDPGGVAGRGGKENRKAVVVVGTFDVDVARAGRLMLELEVRSLESLEGFAPGDGVAADRVDVVRRGSCHVNR